MRHGVDVVCESEIAVDEVDFDDVVVVPGREVANRLGLADLPSTPDYERLSAVLHLPVFKKNIYFSLEIHASSMIWRIENQKPQSYVNTFRSELLPINHTFRSESNGDSYTFRSECGKEAA